MAPPRWINLRLCDSKRNPLADRRYALVLPDGTRRQGHVDAEGFVRESVPAEVESAQLLIADRCFELELSGLPAADTVEGAQQRLNHLNYFTGTPDGELGPFTERAIRRFQATFRDAAEACTGKLDAETIERLTQEYGA